MMASELIKILQESMAMNGDLKIGIDLDHVTYDMDIKIDDDTLWIEGYIEEPRA